MLKFLFFTTPFEDPFFNRTITKRLQIEENQDLNNSNLSDIKSDH